MCMYMCVIEKEREGEGENASGMCRISLVRSLTKGPVIFLEGCTCITVWAGVGLSEHFLTFFILFLKIFYLFIFRERGREGERKGEKHQCGAASCAAPCACLLYTSDAADEERLV